MKCPACAMEVDPSRQACPYCGAALTPQPAYYGAQPYPPPAYYPPPPPAYGAPPGYPPPYGAPPVVYAPPQQSGTATAGGVLLLIGGILAMISGGISLAVGSALSIIPGFGAIFVICGALELIFGIVALLGGINALQRKSWGLALVGSILCLISLGPYGISSILGLIALILIAISRQEFP